jgi:hypothetical protein
VKFSTKDTYYPIGEIEPDILEEFFELTSCTDTPHSTGALPKQWDPTLFYTRRGTSILNKRIIPLDQIPTTAKPNTYKQYRRFYLRGFARRNRYQKRIIRENNQKTRRFNTFTYIREQVYSSTLSTEELNHYNKRVVPLPTIDLFNLVATHTRRTTDTDTYFN